MQKKVKIIINGRFLNKPYTGIGRYSFELIRGLAKEVGDRAELVIVSEAKIMKPWGEILENLENVRMVVKTENRLFYSLNKGLAKTWWEVKTFYKTALKEKADLIFCPYPSALKRKKIPLVVTVHDAIPWLDLEYRSANRLGRFYNQVALKNFQSADQILTVSGFSKKEISQIAPRISRKIEVVYNGISEAFENPVTESDQVIAKYGISAKRRFLFYYGGYDKRKNVARLVTIYKNWLKKDLEMDLVLGGGKILDNSLFEKLENFDGQGIHRVGFIDENDLPAFLDQAVAFINLSRYEGFNLPLAEALASHSVCIVSDIDVNEEVGEAFPLYLNLKQNDEKLGNEIKELLGIKENYQDMREKMNSYQNRFRWEAAAKKTWGIFQKVI